VKIRYDAAGMKFEADSDAATTPSVNPNAKPGAAPTDPKSPARAPARAPSRDGLDELIDAQERQLSTMMNRVAKSMVGTTLTMTIDPDGRITRVSGGEQLAQSGLLDNLGLGAGAGAMPGASPADALFGPVASRGKVGTRAAPGDRWTADSGLSTSVMGPMKMSTDYTLRDVKGDRATITFVGRVDAASADPAGAPAQLRPGAYRGSYVWDHRRGRLLSADSELEVAIGAGANPLLPEMTSSTTMRVRRDGEPAAPLDPRAPRDDDRRDRAPSR
jgi:hypothetical protein